MKTTEEKIAVMQAFLDGKTIEYTDEEGNWYETTPSSKLSWDWWNNEYRIKQEAEYIPFDFTDVKNLIGKSVINKESKEVFLITSLNHNNVVISFKTITYLELLNDYRFLDDSICGKLKQ